MQKKVISRRVKPAFRPSDRLTLSPAGAQKAIQEAATPAEAKRAQALMSPFSLPLWTGPVR